MPEPKPAFVIVGTARSGTTLVQRLASGLPGVVVPPETHFFSHFALGLLRRARFPLRGPELDVELARYAALPVCAGLEMSAGRVAEAMEGECRSVFEMFAAILADLTGPSEHAGEKTPEHLLWWRPLTSAWPGLRVVAVVRDPRAVVASNLGAEFGMNHVEVVADRWSADQRAIVDARDHLGDERLLIVRYESVVADPAAEQIRLAAFLGIDVTGAPGSGVAGNTPERPLYLPWETWKRATDGPITTERVDAWRSELTGAQASIVEALCSPLMDVFGFEARQPADGAKRRLLVALGPARRARRLRYRRGRSRLERAIGRVGISLDSSG